MDEIWRMNASDIAAAVRNRDLSAIEVTESHLSRMAEVNPSVNAVVDEFPEEALRSARQVDEAIARGDNPGILSGVPFTIKINVDQRDHATTNGLSLQKDLVAQQDSPVVSNIRKAGGIIVGRTNTPAFSLRWFTNNRLHGKTLNPRNKEITPGGSSGGAAAAVAAGLCAVGHGTDIAGSIRYPAYACGLHGIRPTIGRVPAYNASAADRFIGPQIMAVSGPISRSITDLELALTAMTAPDPRDPWYVPAPFGKRDFERKVALTVAPDGMPVSEEVHSALSHAAEILGSGGWAVEEVDCPPMRLAAEINACLWMAEMQFGARELIEREGDPDAQFVFAQMSKDIGEVGFDDLMRALQTRASLVREWELFLQDYPLVLCPVSGSLPFLQQADIASEDEFSRILEAQLVQRGVPAIGIPALSVAMGEVENRPVGVQLLGPRFREDILLAAGLDLENAIGTPTVADPDW